MIARIIFWKRFKKLIFGCFAILFGAITCCLLGSWTINEDGNLVGENILKDDLSNIELRRNDCIVNSYGNYSINLTINGANNSSGVYFTLNTLIEQYQVISISFDIYSSDRIIYASLGLEPNVSTVSIGNNYYHYETSVNVVYNYAFVMYFYTTLNSIIDITNIMINTGSSPLPWEPYGVWYSQSNYDDIQDIKFNEGYSDGYQQATSDIYHNTSLGFSEFGLISDISIGCYNSNDVSLGNCYFSYEDISSSNTTRFTNITPLSGSSYYVVTISTFNPFHIVEFKSTQGFYYLALGGSSTTASYIGSGWYSVTPGFLITSPIVSSFTIKFNVNVTNFDLVISGSTTNLQDLVEQYETGYQIGYDAGVYSQQPYIDSLTDRYNSLANRNVEFSFRNLVWYIASTPFESFKSIWNVDFLGLNIASFFTGLFSVFIIVWILKKIF